MTRILERSMLLRRFYFDKSEVVQSLILSYVSSISMVLFRIIYTGETMFGFLMWNMFLGWLPYLISSQLGKKQVC